MAYATHSKSWPGLSRPSRSERHTRASRSEMPQHIGVRKHAVLRTAMAGHDGGKVVRRAHTHRSFPRTRESRVTISESAIGAPVSPLSRGRADLGITTTPDRGPRFPLARARRFSPP